MRMLLTQTLFCFKVNLEREQVLSESKNWIRSASFKLELKCWVMMFALAMSGALVWSGLSCLQASRPVQPLIFRAVRRPVVSGSLGRLVCSLIDGLSVWSNYPTPDWEAGDFVDCYVRSKVHNKPKNPHYMCKLLLPMSEVSDTFQKVSCPTWNAKWMPLSVGQQQKHDTVIWQEVWSLCLSQHV